MVVEESIHIVFNETNDLSLRKKDFSDDDAEITEKEMKKLNLRDNEIKMEMMKLKMMIKRIILKKISTKSMMTGPKSESSYVII